MGQAVPFKKERWHNGKFSARTITLMFYVVAVFDVVCLGAVAYLLYYLGLFTKLGELLDYLR